MIYNTKAQRHTVAQLIKEIQYGLGEDKPEWLSPTQVGKELNMHINTIYRLIKYENLPVHSITAGKSGKGYYRIRRSELEEWMEGRRR